MEASSDDDDFMLGVIAVGNRDNRYFVLGGNKIRNSEVEALKKTLSKLKAMDKDQLKEHYRLQRKSDSVDLTKGAGLGLIDLARKSSEPIDFHFNKLDDQFSFFSLKTII